jgi:hypothetical protein
MAASTSTSTSFKQTTQGTKSLTKSFKRQAQLLQAQANAREQGRQNLQFQLDNAKKRNKDTRRSVIKDLLAGDRTARLGYDRAEEDSTANLGITAASSRLNRAREGSNALAELSNNQGGLTDKIKAMAASVRNMKTNIEGGVSDYANAITSVNNSLGDMNTSTQTNINNALREQNTQDAQAFAEWSAGQQQAYADIVDLQGQKAAAHETMADTLAKHISKSKSTGTTDVVSNQTDSLQQTKQSRKQIKNVKRDIGASTDAANRLAAQMGQTFTDPIMTIDQMNAEEADPSMRYTAAAMKQNKSNLDELANAGTLRKVKDAEGSKLRKKLVA